MKIYSPSEVERYMECPMKWAIGKSGWRPNSFSYGEVTAAIGTGIHKGAYEVHKAVKASGNSVLPNLKEMAIEAALKASKEDIRNYLDAGCFPEVRVEDWEERIEVQVPKGVKAYIEQFPICDEIIGMEESFGLKRGDDGYKGMIDLVLHDEQGLFPADIKTKQPFKSDWYKSVFINSFEYSWQMYHYSWLLNASKFQLIMLEMKGKPVVSVHTFKVDRFYMNQWRNTVQKIWIEMDRIENGVSFPGISNNHYAYGQRCPFYRACLDFKLDESLMNSEYVRLEV